MSADLGGHLKETAANSLTQELVSEVRAAKGMQVEPKILPERCINEHKDTMVLKMPFRFYVIANGVDLPVGLPRSRTTMTGKQTAMVIVNDWLVQFGKAGACQFVSCNCSWFLPRRQIHQESTNGSRWNCQNFKFLYHPTSWW